jgi:hypothetical protein
MLASDEIVVRAICYKKTQMVTKMEKITLDFLELPSEIENLIIKFCYGSRMKDVCLLNDLACVSFINSQNLPVPSKWKFHLNKNKFNWITFLRSPMNPYGICTLISLDAVRETVVRLNWNVLKSNTTVLSRTLRNLRKYEVLDQLHYWTPFAVALVYQIQRLLCVWDPLMIRKGCYGSEYFIFNNGNPLSVYLQPPKVFL